MKLTQAEIIDTLELLNKQIEALERLYKLTNNNKYSIALENTNLYAKSLAESLVALALKHKRKRKKVA